MLGVLGVGGSQQQAPLDPIDVNVSKLSEWVLNTDRLAAKWSVGSSPSRLPSLSLPQSAVSKVDERDGVNAAFQRVKELSKSAQGRLPDWLDEGESSSVQFWAAISAKPELTYFDCVKVLNALEAKAGDGARNWLGRYKDDFLKEWASIVSSYRVHNLFLVEGARILERNIAWEVPFLRSRLQTCDKESTAIDKTIARHENTIRGHLARFQAMCQRRGIQGVNIRRELVALGNLLPIKLNELLRTIQGAGFRRALHNFRTFCESQEATIESQATDPAAEDRVSAQPIPVLSWFAEHGSFLAETPLVESSFSERVQVQEITDWDIDPVDAGNGAEEHGQGPAEGPFKPDSLTGGQVCEGEIDWTGLDEIAAGPSTYDFVQERTDEKEAFAGALLDEEVRDIAVGTPPKHSLTDQAIQVTLQNELIEMEAFFQQRVAEQSKAPEKNPWLTMSHVPEEIRSMTAGVLQEDLAHVQKVATMLSGQELQELWAIARGGPTLDRLVREFKQQQSMADKLRASINQLDAKKSQLAREHTTSRAALTRLRDETLALKQDMAAATCAILNGRKVNILGVNV